MAEGICFLCGNYETVERHHLFGGALRKKADRLKLTVMLCPWCHQYDADSAHRSAEARLYLHRYGQRKAMEEQGWSKDDFIREFGRNYLDEEDLTGDGYLREESAAEESGEGFRLLPAAAFPDWDIAV